LRLYHGQARDCRIMSPNSASSSMYASIGRRRLHRCRPTIAEEGSIVPTTSNSTRGLLCHYPASMALAYGIRKTYERAGSLDSLVYRRESQVCARAMVHMCSSLQEFWSMFTIHSWILAYSMDLGGGLQGSRLPLPETNPPLRI
jgi:hypothetical protein